MKRMGWKAGYAKACRALSLFAPYRENARDMLIRQVFEITSGHCEGEHVKAAYEAPIARADLARPAVLRLGLHGRS